MAIQAAELGPDSEPQLAGFTSCTNPTAPRRMSNCVSGDVGSPGLPFSQDGVENAKKPSHDCDQDDLWRLSGGGESCFHRGERRIAAAGGQGGHVQGAARVASPAVDQPSSAFCAAVVVVRCDTDEGRDPPSVEAAKFRQTCNECRCARTSG